MREDFWIHPDNFGYTVNEQRWLYGQIPDLRAEGLTWPPPPSQEVEDAGIMPRRDYYEGKLPEKGATIIGNLENMLCQLGHAGAMVKLYYAAWEDVEVIARMFNLPPRLVYRRIEDALKSIDHKVNGRRETPGS